MCTCNRVEGIDGTFETGIRIKRMDPVADADLQQADDLLVHEYAT